MRVIKRRRTGGPRDAKHDSSAYRLLNLLYELDQKFEKLLALGMPDRS
jgi:hypothetical protein